jgi:hypothetical protein
MIDRSMTTATPKMDIGSEMTDTNGETATEVATNGMREIEATEMIGGRSTVATGTAEVIALHVPGQGHLRKTDTTREKEDGPGSVQWTLGIGKRGGASINCHGECFIIKRSFNVMMTRSQRLVKARSRLLRPQPWGKLYHRLFSKNADALRCIWAFSSYGLLISPSVKLCSRARWLA